MVVGLKQSVSYVIQAIPKVTLNGIWLSQHIDKNLHVLAEVGIWVRAIVSDNHSSNVKAYTNLREKFSADSSYYIQHPSSDKKVYLFFDNVHLLKNIRNNLLNNKKFVFPSFEFNNMGITISCPGGYITWSDIHKIYDEDNKLKANLRKAPKLSCAIHPGTNKCAIGFQFLTKQILLLVVVFCITEKIYLRSVKLSIHGG